VIEDFLPCAILLPSLGRPQRLADTAKNIHTNTDVDHRIFWCVDGLSSKQNLDAIGEKYIDDSDTDDHRYVTRMNRLCRELPAEFRTVFFGSDDVVHHSFWLERAITVMEEQQKACDVVNDGRNPNGTQALMLRDYLPFAVFDDPEVAFHPGYQHNFADTEMFATAMKYGQYARAPESVVEHLHPIFGARNARPWDATYTNAQAQWNIDSQRFHDRMEALKNESEGDVGAKYLAISELWEEQG
jgi:hypothetical protein